MSIIRNEPYIVVSKDPETQVYLQKISVWKMRELRSSKPDTYGVPIYYDSKKRVWPMSNGYEIFWPSTTRVDRLVRARPSLAAKKRRSNAEWHFRSLIEFRSADKKIDYLISLILTRTMERETGLDKPQPKKFEVPREPDYR